MQRSLNPPSLHRRLHGMRTILYVTLAITALAGTASAQQPAASPAGSPGFRACNKTTAPIEVAKALYTGATDGNNRIIIAEGWYKIAPGGCTYLWTGPLQSRYYLLYGQSLVAKREWAGKIPICVARDAFTIRSDVCTAEFDRRLFFELDTKDEKLLATFTFQ